LDPVSLRLVMECYVHVKISGPSFCKASRDDHSEHRQPYSVEILLSHKHTGHMTLSLCLFSRSFAIRACGSCQCQILECFLFSGCAAIRPGIYHAICLMRSMVMTMLLTLMHRTDTSRQSLPLSFSPSLKFPVVTGCNQGHHGSPYDG
jgi:hypothetical protein